LSRLRWALARRSARGPRAAPAAGRAGRGLGPVAAPHREAGDSCTSRLRLCSSGAACGVSRCERVDGQGVHVPEHCILPPSRVWRSRGCLLGSVLATPSCLQIQALLLCMAQRPRERRARRRSRRGAPRLPPGRSTPLCQALPRAWRAPETPSPPAGRTPVRGRARMGRAPRAPSSVQTRACARFHCLCYCFSYRLPSVVFVGHQVWWVARSAHLMVCARWFKLPGSLAGPNRACQRMPVHYIPR